SPTPSAPRALRPTVCSSWIPRRDVVTRAMGRTDGAGRTGCTVAHTARELGDPAAFHGAAWPPSRSRCGDPVGAPGINPWALRLIPGSVFRGPGWSKPAIRTGDLVAIPAERPATRALTSPTRPLRASRPSALP